ncbi:PREDICTED: outer envelope pore protein 16-4, chloroplastic isoform X1 [Tarenaya hassleriana]|uniref:outer envelope pore protein 16-4, chloroplastic isoform X1 n=1 Tax=Tarenaya hassleriana TaxID=28532 RepID=UPI00053C3456|nr:PREDICTED: outer envelope pore protein 16-4, chloroplastic isoform X1 [Tarenaya hassleriana]
MEEEQMSSVPCSSLAVESAIRVATAGGIFGFCAGPREGRRIGLTGVPQASYVAKYVGRFGFQCGLVGGVFTMTHCGLQRYRGRNDWVNALIAGAVAGGAVAVRTRNLTQVVGTAGLVSAFSVLANYSRTN